MQTVEDINETLDEAQAYARKHPRDRSVRADLRELLQMRNLAQHTPAHFAHRADPQLLANKLDDLNDAWQDLMARPRNTNAQTPVRVLTDERFCTIVTAQRVQDDEYN